MGWPGNALNRLWRSVLHGSVGKHVIVTLGLNSHP
jgi:hypothetical protein